MSMRGLSIIAIAGTLLLLATMPAIAETGADVLPANTYKSWYAELNSGDEWYFSVQADEGVNIKTMSDDNYQIFQSGGSPLVYAEYSADGMLSVSFTIDDLTGEIWIVVETTTLISDTTINWDNTITRFSAPDPNPPDNNGDDGGGDGTPGFTVPIILSAVVIGVAIMRIQQRRK